MFQSLVTVSPYSLWAICRRKSICSAREFCGMGTVHSFTVKMATNGRNQCFKHIVCDFEFLFNSHIIISAFATHHEVFAGCNEPTLFSFQKIFPMGDIIRKMDSHIWKRTSETFVANLQCFADDKKEIKGTLVELLTHSPGSEHLTPPHWKFTFDPFWTQRLEQIEVSGSTSFCIVFQNESTMVIIVIVVVILRIICWRGFGKLVTWMITRITNETN